MEYKTAAQALIKRQYRANIVLIITIQTNNFFRGKINQLSELVLTKKNICAHNPLIYHAEVPIGLYGED